MDMQIMKDEKLDWIIKNEYGNIAQFVSILPNGEIGYSHINEYVTNDNIELKDLIKKLLESSLSKAINIRSYGASKMKGNKMLFNKKIEDLKEILDFIENNKKNDMHSIVNENIDVNDGGVSGVVLGDLIEFSPEDTPKCVDKEGICSLPREMGSKLLEIVYGFNPEINFPNEYRVEFSIHPNRQGVKKEHTIIWEFEKFNNIDSTSNLIWPNNFSRYIGDKVFGLLIADILGFKVPKTTVIARNMAPFYFGENTGMHEKWIRTAPSEKQPGKYYTSSYWTDPFDLIIKEERKNNYDNNIIASLMSQDSVEALYSGASIIKRNKENDIIEGVAGKGDEFMIGNKGSIDLPYYLLLKLKRVNNRFRRYIDMLGEISIEWVFDGDYVWIVQLNQIKSSGNNNIIVEGIVDKYIDFDVKKGLYELQNTIDNIKSKNVGINLLGNVGITSHFGDLLRMAEIPSKLND